MKCSHLPILVFSFLLPGCDPVSDSLEPDESTSGDWESLDESIEIVPLPQGEKDAGDQEGTETGGDEDPMASKEVSESGSLTQDESSSSEEGGSSEESSSSEDEDGDSSTTTGIDIPTSDNDSGDGGLHPWEIAKACYAECKAHESLDWIRAERDAYDEMPRGGDSNKLTCARDVVELRVRALFQQAAIDCRDECDLWRWTDIDRDIEVCTHEETKFLHACYAKYECKLPRQPGHIYDDSRCESVGRKVWDHCLEGWPTPEDTSAIPDLRDFECYSDCHG